MTQQDSGIYSGAAGFGRLYATFSAIAATIFAIGLVIGGIYVIYHRSHLSEVVGKVTKPSYGCVTVHNKNGATTTCKVDVTFTVDKKVYNKTFTSSTQYAKVGMDVNVFYNPSNPEDAEIDPLAKWIGWAMIGGAVFLVVASWGWVWLTQRYKFLAAAEGVKGAYDILR